MPDISTHIANCLVRKSEDAIDLIYDHYASNLYGYLIQMLGDEDDAQDVLQDSFIKIWKNAEQYDASKARLFTWLLNICRNTAIDRIRSRKKYEEKKIQSRSESVYKPVIENNMDHLDIHKHLGKLDVKYQNVIQLLFFSGMTHKEASEALDIPLGTVKTRLRNGLRELHKIYGFDAGNTGFLILLLWMIK